MSQCIWELKLDPEDPIYSEFQHSGRSPTYVNWHHVPQVSDAPRVMVT